MKFRQLKFFVSAFEEGGFSLAAKRENCTQPALSAQIRSLEDTLGNQLFQRTTTGVVPTVAGEKFYGLAIDILKSVASAEIEMAETAASVTGVLNAGLVPSVMRGLIPGFLSEFVEDYPDVKLSLVEGYSAALTRSVAARDLDFAVVVEPPKLAGLEMTRLSREGIVLISGKTRKMTPWLPLDLGALDPLKLIIPTVNNSLGAGLHQLVQLGQIPTAQVLEIDALNSIIEIVQGSDWVTILPFTAILRDVEKETLIFSPITTPEIQSDFVLIHRTQHPLSAAAQLFVAKLKLEMDISRQAWSRKISR